MHYYQFNIGDYASHTQHLDEIEDLAYRRMLDYCYLNECGLPETIDRIARVIRMPQHCSSIANVLQEFFTQHDDGTWQQVRINKEIAGYRKKSEEASKKARKRWENAYAAALPQQSRCNAKHKPITNNQEPVIIPAHNTSAVATVAKHNSKGSRLPTDWALPKDWGNWALERGLSRDAVLLEAETFRNHWVSKTGKDACKADWEATWRNWIIRALKDKPKTYYELTQEAKERDADKRMTGLASADMETLEALGLARDGRILGS